MDGQTLELVLYLIHGGQRGHALGPGPELAGGLRTSQEQDGEQRQCRGVDGIDLVRHVAVAGDRPPVRGKDEPGQPLLLQLHECSQYRVVVHGYDRVTIGGLVTGQQEGVCRQRVLLGSGQLLLHQAAEHTAPLGCDRHGPRLVLAQGEASPTRRCHDLVGPFP